MPDVWPEDDAISQESPETLWYFLRPKEAIPRFTLIVQEPSGTRTVDLHLNNGPLLACMDLEYHISRIPAEHKTKLPRKLMIYLKQLRTDVTKEVFSPTGIRFLRADTTIESGNGWAIRTVNNMGSSNWGRGLYETACQVAGKTPYKGVVSLASKGSRIIHYVRFKLITRTKCGRKSFSNDKICT
jgi:hypothetical protein